jgi:hypothetical protein
MTKRKSLTGDTSDENGIFEFSDIFIMTGVSQTGSPYGFPSGVAVGQIVTQTNHTDQESVLTRRRRLVICV